jgi:sugar lactone lactonase YvrE
MKNTARFRLLSLLAAGFCFLGFTGLFAQTVQYAGSAPALNFGSVNICASGQSSPAPCNKTLTLTYNVKAGGTLGTPKVLTLGAPDLDFALASGGTCVGTVTTGMACTVNVKFAPRFAGSRQGAVQLTDSGGNVLTTTLIYGNGVGSQIAFLPDVLTSIQVNGPGGTPSSGPISGGLAIDGAGDLFFADSRNNRIVELPAGGGAQTSIGSGWSSPAFLAIDGAGDLFVADSGNNRVVKYSLGDGAQTTIGTGLSSPTGVAMDAAGDLFIEDTGNNRVIEVAAGGGTQTTVYQGPADDSVSVAQLAVDQAGDAYIGTSANLNDGFGDITTILTVTEIPANGGPQTTPYTEQVTNYEGLEYRTDIGPLGLAVDGAGNLYISYYSDSVDEYNDVSEGDGVFEIPAGSDISTTLFEQSGSYYGFPASGFGALNIAVNADGNLYYSDADFYNVGKIDRTTTSPLSFGPSAVGSVDGPLSVTIQNIGNAPLKFSGINAEPNFEQVPGSGTPPDCSENTAVAPGTDCNLSISFLPTELGPLTGVARLTDNSLNPAGSTQDIPLSGTGQVPALKVTVNLATISFPTIKFGQQDSIPLILTNTGNGSVTVGPVSISGPSFTVSSNSCTTIQVGEGCAIYVLYSPVTVGTHDDVLTLKVDAPVSPSPKIKLSGVARGVGATETWLYYGSIPFGTTKTLPLTIENYGIAENVTVKTSISGPSFKILSAGNTCLTGVASGQTCTMQVEYSPVATGGHLDILTVTPSFGAASTVKLGGFATAP